MKKPTMELLKLNQIGFIKKVTIQYKPDSKGIYKLHVRILADGGFYHGLWEDWGKYLDIGNETPQYINIKKRYRTVLENFLKEIV